MILTKKYSECKGEEKMSRLDTLLISMKTKAATLKNSLVSKQHGDSQVVVALILIVVALGLAIIFRNEVNDIITSIADRVGEAVNQLADGAVNAHN